MPAYKHRQYLIKLCQQLAEKGLQPSVALLRSKACVSIPVPDAIDGLKHYKANPEQVIETTKPQPDSESSLPLEQRVVQLEKQVSELQQALAALQSKL